LNTLQVHVDLLLIDVYYHLIALPRGAPLTGGVRFDIVQYPAGPSGIFTPVSGLSVVMGISRK
jgi:hypothetical protein